MTPSGWIRNGVGSSRSMVAGVPATMSFGRPVLPPEVGAFHAVAIRSGSASHDSAGSGSKRGGTVDRPATEDSGTPTTSAASASSTMASRSAAGSRHEIGWGVAPSFQTAITASRNSAVFGSPMVTKRSGVTPSAAYARASRFVRRSSSPRVTVRSASVMAGRSGSRSAQSRSACGKEISAM